MRRLRPASILLGLGLLVALASPAAEAKDEVASLLTAKKRDLTDRSLHVRHRAWRAIAATKDPRALEALEKAYERKGEEENGRVLLVSAVCDAFDRTTDVPALSAWREKHATAADQWLWYRTLRSETGAVGPSKALEIARSASPAWQRAVAIEVLAAWGEPDALPLLGDAAAALPVPPRDRALVLEALAEVLASQAGRRGTAEHRAAALWLVGHLDRPETPARSRLAIVRALVRVYRPPVPYLDAAFWRVLIESPTPPREEHRYAAPPAARFLELTGTGDRVVYVIDGSGSMNEPLTETEIAALRGEAERVGSRGNGGGKPIGKGEEDVDPATLQALPWDRIRLRIDAAVEFLKLSLRQLKPEARFCVVLFGTEAKFLPATPALVAATPAALKEAAEDLDRFRVGGLLGGTNLHGGLRRALQVTDAKPGGREKDPDPLLAGATTVFLLSDGYPTEDDWTPGSPVKGTRADLGGTYADVPQLLEDVERLNLLRRTEIHAVGFGADLLSVLKKALPPGLPLPRSTRLAGGSDLLLRGLAALGHGNYRLVPGRGADPAPTNPPEGPQDGAAAQAKRARAELGRENAAWLRCEAATTLGRIRCLDSVPDLIALLTDEDDELREAAREALERIGDVSLEQGLGTRRHEQVRLQRNWTWWWEANEARLRGR